MASNLWLSKLALCGLISGDKAIKTLANLHPSAKNHTVPVKNRAEGQFLLLDMI